MTRAQRIHILAIAFYEAEVELRDDQTSEEDYMENAYRLAESFFGDDGEAFIGRGETHMIAEVWKTIPQAPAWEMSNYRRLRLVGTELKSLPVLGPWKDKRTSVIVAKGVWTFSHDGLYSQLFGDGSRKPCLQVVNGNLVFNPKAWRDGVLIRRADNNWGRDVER